MKTTDYISVTIDKLPKGYIFTYNDFVNTVNSKEAVVKALNRMAVSGKIAKVSKGKFYKPKDTVFGALKPSEYQIVKDLLEEDGKAIGYLTGLSIYNQLGLTTQVSNTIQIGKNQIRPRFKRSFYTISFVRQSNIITKENIPLLQILDAIRYVKKIPDGTLESSCKRFMAIIRDLQEKDKATMVRLAQKYPPATPALLGSILEEMGSGATAEPLRKSLNPITAYKLSGITKALPSAEKWNIK